jgi:hypothetical protein
MKVALLALTVAAAAVGFTPSLHAAATVSLPKCPSHAPKFTATEGQSTQFVRPNAKLLRLCRYYKDNWADSQGLWRQRRISDDPTISSLTRQFDALQEPPRGIFCVKDDHSEILVIFGYAGTTPERVVVKLSGCRFASNGKAVRSTTQKLHDRLLRLSRS